jgi:hypothetical protein
MKCQVCHAYVWYAKLILSVYRAGSPHYNIISATAIKPISTLYYTWNKFSFYFAIIKIVVFTIVKYSKPFEMLYWFCLRELVLLFYFIYRVIAFEISWFKY